MDKVKTKVSEGGRVVIPAAYRKELDIKPGDDVVLTLEEGEVRLITARQAVRRAQNLVRHYVPEDRQLSQELIQERREEDANE
ncbi:MAG: AbrB/MazE/SpoVT family DNA-binding domain-containing protein [Deltaproteobacteria bacterium]|nr:AbrB/MazE/SpoVT family DNA-binding domain-containing protein [Chloroflexota bacterium]MBM3301285.1 AbrB/MazE/SpoVT family DNA-binding domain-containing protein [Deltaproteobacteria bacterium]